MKVAAFQKPFLSSAELAQALGTSKEVIEVWPFAAPKPPVTNSQGQAVYYSLHVEEWLGLFMTEEETAVMMDSSLRSVVALRKGGFGPPHCHLGRGEPGPVTPGSSTWQQGREIVIYERAAVERWLNPQLPGRRRSPS